MNREAIFQALEAIVKERSGLKSAIRADARFKEDLEIDSLLVIDIVVDVEKAFGISLPDEEIIHVCSLDTVTDLVQRILSPLATTAPGTKERLEARLLGGVGNLAQPAY